MSGGWRRTAKKGLATCAGIAVALPVMLAMPAIPAGATIGTLPDGTEVELTITSPADGSAPVNGAVDLSGTARVGAGGSEPDTSLVIVYDASGSTLEAAGGNCGGDVNGDGSSNTILDCEIAAIDALVQKADELGSVSEIGVSLFELNGRATDLGPASGFQTLTTPGADANNNGINDIHEVIVTTRYSAFFIISTAQVTKFTTVNAGGVSGGTNYSAGLASACQTLAATSEPNRVVVFLSDGGANRGTNVSSVLPCAQSATFNTFAVGALSTCALNPSGLGSLQQIANLTGGTCTEVIEPSDLPDILVGSFAPEIVKLELSVNGEPPTDISDAAAIPLPARGPAPFEWNHRVEGLQGPVDELCVTAHARRGPDTTTVTDCVTIVDNRPPVADAGDDLTVVEGDVASLDGTGSTDPDGDPLSYDWTLVSQVGPPILLTSTTDPVASFATLDDGEYELRLEVSDGRETSTDSVVVTVQNGAPVVDAASEPAAEGGVALITATFTDGGPLDSHVAEVDWGDGSPPDDVTISAQGTGWGSLYASHVYAGAGSYTATVRVIDDDGGTGQDTSVGVEVRDALALWANSQTAIRALDWTGGEGTASGLVHSNNDVRISGAGKNLVDGRTEFATTITVSNQTTIAPTPVRVPPAPFPVVFELADYRPGGRAAIEAGATYHDMAGQCVDGTWQPGGPLLPGLYYAPCNVHLVSSALTGAVTVAAEGSIQVSGTDAVFDPYIDGLLFISGSTGDDAIDVSASNSRFLGFLFAGAGGVDLAGQDDRYLCGILADRIDLSGTRIEVRASDCVRPRRTSAPPVLVPDLTVDVDNDLVDALPGDSVTTSITVANSGATLLTAGIVGVENLGTLPVTVTGIDVGLEVLEPGATVWTPIAAPVEVSFRADPAPGVTPPPDGSAVNPTLVAPAAIATWAAEVRADLTPDVVAALLDPARTAGVRTVVEFELDNPTAQPVRRLYRFGTDLVTELRAIGGDLTDVAVTATSITGLAERRDAADDATLARLAPGQSATIELPASVGIAAPRGSLEPSAAYLQRLLALDGVALQSAGFASATGGIGRILGALDSDATTRRVPAVTGDLTSPETAVAGDTIELGVRVSNRGSAPATTVSAAVDVDGAGEIVNGLTPGLAVAGVSSGTAIHEIDDDRAEGVLPAALDVSWTDARGNAYGPVEDTTTTLVGSAPDLSALLADRLWIDADNTGLPSPGDTIRYEATITNRGSTPTSGVTLTVPIPAHTTLVAGSVTGAAVVATSPALVLDVADIGGVSSADIGFNLLVHDPVPDGVTTVSVQGTVDSDDTDPFFTDDPGEHGSADPTVTRLVDTPPRLEAALASRLAVDVDGNGYAGPGDEIAYLLQVTNAGLSSATGVVLDVPVDAASVLVAGSLTTDLGTIVSGSAAGDDAVVIEIDALPGLDSVLAQWTVKLREPVPSTLTELRVQGTADAAELDPIVTDDPTRAGTQDETVTAVFIGGSSGGGGGGSGGGGSGPPGASIEQLGPPSGTVLTQPVVVSVDGITPPPGTTVESWRVVAYPAGGDPAQGIELAAGDGAPPTDAATFDPTTVGNGTWIVRVEVLDSGGGVGVAETDVVVEGQLKPGRYAVSWVDADVAIGGIPLRVVRSYDTVDRASSGDFGYGWSLDVADFQVTTNGPLGEGGWEQYGCGSLGLIFVKLCFRTTRRHEVTVRWPDGRVERFDFTPDGLSTFWPIGVIPKYTAKPGTTSTLEPVAEDGSGTWLRDGNIYGSLFSLSGPYDPSRWWLVAQDGTRYLLDENEGLMSSVDRNGNTVTVNENGIISSLGASLLFQRDSAGRITQLTEPGGAVTTYEYDVAGDLVEVVDANANETTFTYTAGHYLTVIDDEGPGAYRTLEYGPDGRLIAITDAAGNITEVSVDLDARTETTTSPDGRLTEITTSDERGNPTRVERVYDGRSEVSTFTYDENDRPTSVTDAEGNTSHAAWDERQNLTSITDAEGGVTTWTYNDRGAPTSTTDPTGAITTYTYDAAGNLVGVTLPDASAPVSGFAAAALASSTIVLDYDDNGNLVSVTDELGRTSTYDYDAAGRLIESIDAADNAASYTYDAAGRLTSWTDGEGGVTHWAYDDRGNVLTVTDALDRVTTWTYDGRDLATSIEDPSGRTWTYGYDDLGALATITDPLGEAHTWTYEFGRLVTEHRPDGGTVVYSYDGAGRLATRTDPLGRTTTYTYDSVGRKVRADYPAGDGGVATERIELDDAGRTVAAIDAEGARWEYGYDPAGRVIEVTDPLGGVATTVYDPRGRVRRSVDELGRTTTYEYDAVDQLISMTDPTGAAWRWEYDLAGRAVAEIDPMERRTEFGFDRASRLVSTTDANGAVESWDYDAAGQLVGHQSAAGVSTTMDYDRRGLLVGTTDELGHTTSYGYDAAGRHTSTTDPRDNTTSHVLDPLGRVLETVDPLGGRAVATYDLAGQLTSIRDPNGGVRTYEYDDDGNQVSETDPLGETSTASYDRVGRLVSATDARGITIDYVPDALGRLVTESSPDGVITHVYDAASQRTSMTDPTGITTFEYDGAGRLTSVAAPGGAVQYTHDASGMRTSMTTPAGTVQYALAPDGGLESLTDWDGRTTGFTFDADGRPLRVVRPNGVTTTHGYDAAGRLTSVAHAGAGVNETFSYGLDAAGNRTSATVSRPGSSRTETYTYDGLDRLVGVDYGDGVTETNTYDAAGNRTSSVVAGGPRPGTTTYTYDLAQRLVSMGSPAGAVVLGYDAAGNMVDDGRGATYSWDAAGQLVGRTAGGDTVDYSYDGDGIRTAVDGVAQVWDRAEGLPELVATGDGRAYVHASGRILLEEDGSAASSPLLDGLASVRRVTDGAGALTGSVDYDAWGAVRGASGVRTEFGFTGEQTDAGELLFLRARSYDPSTGRFLSRDPMQPNLPGTQGWSWYGYVGGNPTSYVDPTGLIASVEYGTLLKRISAASITALRILGLCIKGILEGIAWTLMLAPVFGAGYGAGDALLDCIIEPFFNRPRGPHGAGPGGPHPPRPDPPNPKPDPNPRPDGPNPKPDPDGPGPRPPDGPDGPRPRPGDGPNGPKGPDGPGPKYPDIPPGSKGGDGAGKPIPKSLRDEWYPEGEPVPPCAYCRTRPGDQLDHVDPRSKGGDLTPENITPSCNHCNPSKGDRPAPKTPPPEYNGAWPPDWWPQRMKDWWNDTYGGG